MSVSIRLAKFGKKHAPSYRVVVTKTRTKRNGAFIANIGHYNPSDKTKDFVIDKKIYEDWVSKGAIVSDAVKKLVEGTYEYKKYEPKKTVSEDAEGAESGTAKAAPKAKEAVVENAAKEKDTPKKDAEKPQEAEKKPAETKEKPEDKKVSKEETKVSKDETKKE